MKKRILFILHLPLPIHGSSIVGQQIKNSKLIADNFNEEYIDFGTSQNVSDIGNWSFYKIISYIRILFSILKKLITNKYDLIYIAPTVSLLGFYKDFLVILLVKLFNKKIVFHLHNKGISKRKLSAINNFLYNFAFKDVEVILLSKLLYDEINEFVPQNKIHICPNGFNLIANLEDKILTKSKNKIVHILFLSNLLESKGVYVLLESLKLVKDKQLAFKCSFVGGEGDISSEKFKLKASELDLLNEVQYLGKKFGDEKHNFFLSGDIFVLPTLNETFGIVNIEAMQYSLPIISTNEGGIPDVIENEVTGFIIEKNNTIELANKLILLIENEKLRRQLGENGRRKFINQYTLDRFEKNMTKILTKIS